MSVWRADSVPAALCLASIVRFLGVSACLGIFGGEEVISRCICLYSQIVRLSESESQLLYSSQSAAILQIPFFLPSRSSESMQGRRSSRVNRVYSGRNVIRHPGLGQRVYQYWCINSTHGRQDGAECQV